MHAFQFDDADKILGTSVYGRRGLLKKFTYLQAQNVYMVKTLAGWHSGIVPQEQKIMGLNLGKE
jgi:hypothetical protein